MTPTLTFKIAQDPWEFEQIHKFNYDTFVEEIPQHEPNADGILIDKFHKDNVYVTCFNEKTLIGMLAIRDKRPFSLDKKLNNLDSYLPDAHSVCEIRLLAVKQAFRNTFVFKNLIKTAAEYCIKQQYDLAIISGILKQQKLYKHLGFLPFGPIVGREGAYFQPMYLTPRSFQKSKKLLQVSCSSALSTKKTSFLPGPVEITSPVQKALSSFTISHRSEEFLAMHRETKRLLCKLVNAKQVEVFLGSGSLANDIIAGQLSLLAEKGLILTNGEFGERLIRHARGFTLPFKTVSFEWGKVIDSGKVSHILDQNPDIKWIWMVHCETSTSMVNDVNTIKDICNERELRLCIDCISSIGTTQVDLQGVYLASGVSGKGLGSYPGISMVFYNHKLAPSEKSLPVYLYLHNYSEKNGVPFTSSSNLVYALNTSLKDFNLNEGLRYIYPISQWLQEEVHTMGLTCVTPHKHSNPFVITIKLPLNFNTERIGAQMEQEGYYLSYQSAYLLERNWIQICLMGDFSTKRLQLMLEKLRQIILVGSTKALN